MSNQPGPLRGTANLARSKQWLHAFDAIARKHQVTTGGGSLLMYQVENELLDESSDRSAFLKALTSYVRADGITVPLFTNDYSMAGHFSDTSKYGTDFYAYDSYPLGFTCNGKRNALSDHEAEFRAIAPTTPQFITEAQGGAFTPWGAPFTPSACAKFADPAFTRQWGVSTIGNGVTAFNYYMLEGGTNWGWTGAPASGFTSYDYGAALDEERTLTDKFAVQKEIGYFQRALPWLAATNPVSAPEPTDVKGSPVHAYQRTTGATGPRFIGFRLGDSNATTDTTFTTPLDLDSDGSANRQHVVDDRDSAISYQGSWVQRSDPGASGKTLTVSSRKGGHGDLDLHRHRDLRHLRYRHRSRHGLPPRRRRRPGRSDRSRRLRPEPACPKSAPRVHRPVRRAPHPHCHQSRQTGAGREEHHRQPRRPARHRRLSSGRPR